VSEEFEKTLEKAVGPDLQRPMKIVIKMVDGKFTYKFSDHKWNHAILTKVARGLGRGLRRNHGERKRAEAGNLSISEQRAEMLKTRGKPFTIPAKRPGEDLGGNPNPTPPPMAEDLEPKKEQPSMPMEPGIKVATHSKPEVIDAETLPQPQPADSSQDKPEGESKVEGK